MKALLLIFAVLITPGASIWACSADIMQKLSTYGASYKERAAGTVSSLNTFSTSIYGNYKFLNNYTINKSEILEDDFFILVESEEVFIDEVDRIYTQHEEALELFGDSEDQALYSELLACVTPEKKDHLIELVENHLKEVNLDDSTLTAIFDSYYNYSSLLVARYDSYLDWLANNEKGNIPSTEMFQPILNLSEKIKVGGECVKDLMNSSYRDYCLLEKELGLNSAHCRDSLYSEVSDCF